MDWLPFYVAEIAIALEYLSKKGIVHRNLTASNILLDSRGHIKIIDFKSSVIMHGDAPVLNFIDALGYDAPEIVNRNLLIKDDWFALGILIIQMSCNAGSLPENVSTVDSMFIKKLKMPSLAKSLVYQLCSKGSKGLSSLASLQKHSFFAGIDWQKLILNPLSTNGPFIPKTKKNHCSQ